jgi:carbon-monoxide dehydrogenase medium subunit
LEIKKRKGGYVMVREYLFPESVDEAVVMLAKNNGAARVISGGTDLVIDLEAETVIAEVLVDVTRVKNCKQIEFTHGNVVIGAGVTMTDVMNNKQIKTVVSALAQAAGNVGSPQIRNSATLAGNVVRAQPAADSAVMLAALDAKLTVWSPGGERELPVQEAYAGVGKSVVDSHKEVVSKITFKEPQKNQGTGYVRLAQRKALALPMLNIGVMVSVCQGKIEWARIIMSPVGSKPTRAEASEAFLAGREPSADVLKEAGQLAVKNAAPRSSYVRGSKEYRLGVLPSLVERALTAAINEIISKGGMGL